MPQQVLAGHTPGGQPVYIEVLSAEEIREALAKTPAWKSFCERFDMTLESNINLVNALFGEKLGPDSQLDDYTRLLTLVISAGGIVVLDGTSYEFELAPVAEPEPEVPTDRNGRPLSEAQIRWSEYRQFAESHGMKAIRERARTDAGFAGFVQKNYERETGAVGDAVENLNQRNQPSAVTDTLREWARVYRTTPSDQVRRLSRFDTNPDGAAEYNASMQAAISAGLI